MKTRFFFTPGGVIAASIVGTALMSVSSAPTLAQDVNPPAPPDSAPSAAAVEEIVVTGSHIRGGESAQVVNVQTLSREDIEQTGAAQMVDLLSSIPSNSGTTQYNESGQLTGTAQFQLRGLGFSSTLTLLNGRRAGVSPLSDKSGADFVDINQFPLAMIERVDVLKDGSSAIYGSEAVAGVVNLVTRKGFEGFELSGDYASSTNRNYSINLATGHRFDRGTLNFYATYYNQTGNVRSDFPWLMERVGGNGVPGRSQLLSSNGFPASFRRATVNASGQPVPVSNSTTVPDPGCVAAGGVFAVSAASVTNSSVCNYNFADQIGVIAPQDRIQTFAEGEYALTDTLTFFNESSFSRNVNELSAHAGGFANGSAPGGQVLIPADHPFNLFVADPGNPLNIIYIDPANWNPAIHQAVPVIANLRPGGSYVDGTKKQSNTYLRTVNGLELVAFSDWRASLSHQYAYAEFQENFSLGNNGTGTNSLLASGLYNPFASSVLTPNLVSPKNPNRTAGNSQSIIDQLFYTSNELRRTEQQVVDLSISGAAVDLPAGPLSVAVGGQFREQSLRYLPDPLAAQGLGAISTKLTSFSGSQQIWSEYVEAIIPVHEVLQVQAAVRHEDYGAGIGDTLDPKVSARLKLLDGKLGLRGSWGTSFQGPTLAQNVTTVTFATLTDPVIRDASGAFVCSPTPVTAGGFRVETAGGNLKPQDSENFDFGIDLSPLPSLVVSGDFWRYDYSDLIAAGQNAQSILDRQCVNGAYVPDPRVDHVNGKVSTSLVNVGKVVAQGIDLSATYALSLNQLGDLSLKTDATFVDKFDIQGANGVITDAVGSRNFNTNFAPVPAWRASARAAWSMNVHELALGLNFTDSYHNDQSNNAPISSFTTVDVQYSLRLRQAGDTLISIGLNNALDRDPPALRRYNANGQPIRGTNNDFDRPGYDALAGASIEGRIIYGRVRHSF